MRPGLVEIVEACYRLDGDVRSWMHGVGAVVDAYFGYGLGAVAVRYRRHENRRLQPLLVEPVNMAGRAVTLAEEIAAALPTSLLEHTCVSYATEQPASRLDEHLEPQGRRDMLCINGVDSTHGIFIGAWLPKRGKMTSAMRRQWNRVAAHMAAAHRLRTRLGDEDGTLGAPPDHEVSGLGLAERRALLAARWTLIDQFDRDGERYVLVRRNAPVPRGLDALTRRERQALELAQLGHPNKLIAYEMQVAASTVAVLLYRAAKKLGCVREQLVETYTRMLATGS